MCMDAYHDKPKMPEEGEGFKCFKRNDKGGLISAVIGKPTDPGFKRGRWLRAEKKRNFWDDELSWDGAGWYIFKTLQGAKMYADVTDIIHRVRYRELMKTGVYDVSPDWDTFLPRIACTAKEMLIKEEVWRGQYA